MKRMRQFLTTLVVIWTAAAIATYFYSQQQHIPSTIVLVVLPAFLWEAGFYLMPGFEAVRKWFDELGSKPLRAALLSGSAVIPYLVESPRNGTFHLLWFLALVGAVLVASFWYVWLEPNLAVDLLFL